jgi:hypothetical protein
MSTWISKAAALLCALALAACQVEGGFGTTRTAPVLNGALSFAVPSGYCVDRSASREKGDSAVVIMGRCSDTASVTAALITVAVGQGGSAGVMTAGGPALAAFFTSPQGRATLSRDGRARDIRVIEAIGAGDALLLHLTDREVGEYWRGVVGVKGRLVTVSATGTPGVPLSPAEGRKLIDRLLAAMASANRGGV